MDSIVLLSTCIFHQSAVLLLLVTLAQTWRPPTASTSTSATTAAVGLAPTLIGSALPVFKIQPLELEFGSRKALSALQKAVVVMVRILLSK